MGEQEIGTVKAVSNQSPSALTDQSYIMSKERFRIPLTTMRGRDLPEGAYYIKISLHKENSASLLIKILEDDIAIAEKRIPAGLQNIELEFQTSGGKLELYTDPQKQEIKFSSMLIKSRNTASDSRMN